MSIFDNDYYNDKNIAREYSLKNTHIGFDNILKTGAVTASTGTGYSIDSLYNGLTYDFWRSSGTTTTESQIFIDAGQFKNVDYLGIAKHNLQNRFITLEISSNGVDFVEHVKAYITSNRTLMLIFSKVSARYFRLKIGVFQQASMVADFQNQYYEITSDFPNGEYHQIGALSLGESLEMQRMIYGGFNPFRLQPNYEVKPTESEGAQWLGRSVLNLGNQTSYDFKNITSDWARSKLLPFIDYAKDGAFFIAWRPLGYATEAQYCWTTKPVSVPNQGGKKLVDFSMQVEACE